MHILITGANSYVGTKTTEYLKKLHSDWTIDKLSLRGDEWRSADFSPYDALFHVAGLVHQKITEENEPLYYSINRDLAYDVAVKAKNSGIRHFILMSTMSVYSDRLECISKDTPVCPDNAYGASKLQAEELILPLQSDSFIVSVLRPPMIYGKNCKGNYDSLRKLAVSLPVFPKVDNKRSMLYIDNLSEFVRCLLTAPQTGVFFPQNSELVNTSEWARAIAEANGKKLHLSAFLGVCARIGKHIPGVSPYCQKAFGDSYYLPAMSRYQEMDYNRVSFDESIILTEEKS